jgi:hypothetical protein
LRFEKSKLCGEDLIMSFISTVLPSLAALLLGACLCPAAAVSLPIRTLAKGGFSGIQQPTQEFLKDKAAWEKTWARHVSGKEGQKTPEVDFSKEMVIVVTLGRKSTGGYSIEITKVEPAGDNFRISVARKSPPAGAMTIQALTAPFHFIAVPKSDLHPEFLEVKPS